MIAFHQPFRISILAAFMLLSACSLAPEYHRPDMVIPEAYKENPGIWQHVELDAANTDRGAWWEVFHDENLNALEEKVVGANQDLKAALARYDQARSAASYARAGYYPTIALDAKAGRQAPSQAITEVRALKPYNNFLAGGDISYELDLWGRVRNSVAAGNSRSLASAADLGALDVSLHAELATDYFSLRAEDARYKILNETVISYKKALELTQARHEGGAAAQVDVDQAETQLANAQTLAADAALKRAQLEHAIAVLVGEMPSTFTLAVSDHEPSIPGINSGIPSTLLEKRPDIAAAALRVQAANADIGVARAAYFPDFSLSAGGGFESALMPKLFNAPSLFWSIGPSALFTIFDGGKISALSEQARAAYNESVAHYKQTVLAAFQQVEDNLVALKRLEEENITQTIAVNASHRTLEQAKRRYSGGIATYFDVVTAQNTALQAELNAADLTARRLNASVLLIKALGGGWNKDRLP